MAAKKKTTTPAAVEKKTPAPRAVPRKKVEAPAPVVAAASGAEVSEGAPVLAAEALPVEVKAAEQALRVSRSEFTKWVREAAFQLAQQRQFRNGTPANDWFRAEEILTEQLAAKGVAIVD